MRLFFPVVSTLASQVYPRLSGPLQAAFSRVRLSTAKVRVSHNLLPLERVIHGRLQPWQAGEPPSPLPLGQGVLPAGDRGASGLEAV